MPNPKLGTVTMDVKGAVSAAKSGQVEFRAEKAGIVHAGIGKASFEDEKLLENIRAFVDAIQKAKPDGGQGHLCEEGGAELHDGAGRARRRDELDRGVTNLPAFGPAIGRVSALPTCPRPHVALRALRNQGFARGRRERQSFRSMHMARLPWLFRLRRTGEVPHFAAFANVGPRCGWA